MMSAAVLNPHHAGHERSEDISRQLRSGSTVDKSKLWSDSSVGAVCRRSHSERCSPPLSLPPPSPVRFAPSESWSGKIEDGSGGRAVVARYFAPSSTKNSGDIATRICRWVEGIQDKHGGRTMLLWIADVNGDFGPRQVVGGVTWSWRLRGTTLEALSSATKEDSTASTVLWCHRPLCVWSALVERRRWRSGGCSLPAREKGETTSLLPSRLKCS